MTAFDSIYDCWSPETHLSLKKVYSKQGPLNLRLVCTDFYAIYQLTAVGGYAQHKGFGCFNWTSTGGLKIDQSTELGLKKLQETYIAKSDFIF